jgi:hypothetical protein
LSNDEPDWDTVEKQQRILRIFEDYCEHAKLKVNVEKCVTTSSIFDREERGRRHSIWVPLTRCGKDVPVNIHPDSVKSLGFPIGGDRHERSLSGNTTLTEMRLTIDKITKSPPFVVQKIQELRTYVLPRIDFLLLNSDVLKSDLKAFDEHMRGEVQKWIGNRGIPVAVLHLSWNDGGLPIPSLCDRRLTQMLRTFAHMMLSKDRFVKRFFRFRLEEERINHHMDYDEESPTFCGWKLGSDTCLPPIHCTITLTHKTYTLHVSFEFR